MPAIDKLLIALTIIVGIIVVWMILTFTLDTIALFRNKQLRAFREGKRARRRGKKLTDNPYNVGTKEASGWMLGWMEESREWK